MSIMDAPSGGALSAMRTEGANRNIFPAGFYDRELVHRLHNVKITFKLDAQ